MKPKYSIVIQFSIILFCHQPKSCDVVRESATHVPISYVVHVLVINRCFFLEFEDLYLNFVLTRARNLSKDNDFS